MLRVNVEVPIHTRALLLGLVLAALMAAGLLVDAKPAQAKDFTVTNTNGVGQGSLRKAILDANASKGADVIKFNIPGAGVKTISSTQDLNAITDPVVIDGYSQPGASPNSRQTGPTDAVILIELSGASNTGSFSEGLDIETSNVVVRGLAINRFFNGINIEPGTGVKIEGNFIGTDPSGTLDRGNTNDGVQINGGSKHTVGGILSGQRNLISGNNGDGVDIRGKGGNNKVQGNLMGVQKDGSTIIGGSGVGVRISTPKNTIGGTEPGAANTIAHNFDEGVRIDDSFDGREGGSSVGNRILSNSIFSNGDLDIDLKGDGRTDNDPKDPDKGENTLQNFPVLTSIKLPEDDKIFIEGTLDSTPSTRKKKKRFTIQFFSNPQNEDEGQTFLGETKVTTNKQGKASFNFEPTQPISSGDRITATATGPGGNTSEFSDPLVLVT